MLPEPVARDSFLMRVRRAGAYLWHDYPFQPGGFNYDSYWDKLSQAECTGPSVYKRNLVASLVEKGSSVFDVGCGDGLLLQFLVQSRGVRAFGIDVSENAVERARQKGLDVRRADVTSESFAEDRIFDYIIISEVLEHLPRPEDLVLRLRENFRKYMIVTVPNSGFLGERLRLLFGRFPKQWFLHPAEHLRFWTVADFVFWARQLGLRVERVMGMMDEYYDIKVPLWKYLPSVFSRYNLYLLIRSNG
jgi:methionine biosynthesis protein MetW